jgi:hypothetical protein
MGKRIFFTIVIVASGVAWFGLGQGSIKNVLATGSGELTNSVASLSESQAISDGTTNEATCGSTGEMALSCQEMEQRILSTTLRIEIETWIIYVEGQGYTTLSSNGHGTVMDGRYLLTHNHFVLPLLELLADDVDGEFATVTLYSADGNFL